MKIKIFALTLLIFLILFNYSNIKAEYIPYSPDEAQIQFFAQNFIKTGDLTWKSELNDKYNTTIFAPRNIADIGDNTYAAKRSQTFILNVAVFTVFSKIDFFSPLFGLFGLIIIFVTVSKIFNKRIGLISTILVGISPIYLMYSNLYWEHVPIFVMTILSYYTFIKFIDSERKIYIILATIFSITALFIRPLDIIPIMSFYVTILILYRSYLDKNTLSIIGLITIILLIPNLFVNKLVFGGFFNFPEIAGAKALQETADDYNIIPMSLDAYYTSFLNHVILIKIVFIMAIIGIIYTYLKGNIDQKKFTIAILVYSIATFLFYGARDTTYQFGNDAVVASMNRYFLPISVMSYLFAGVFLYTIYSNFNKHLDKSLNKHKLVTIRLVTIILILLIIIPSLSLAFVSIYGMDNRTDIMKKLTEKVEMINKLPENSVILTSTDDKYIFPMRDVAIIYTPESRKIRNRANTTLMYRVLDIDTEIKPLILQLMKENEFVYIIQDDNTLPLIRKLKQDSRFELGNIKKNWLLKIRFNRTSNIQR